MPIPSTNIRILIADDDPIARDLIRSILRRHPNMEIVGEASDGVETLAFVQQLRPDVLILDILMPKLQGFDALYGVRVSSLRMAVIVLSGSITKQQELEALQAGAQGVLMKKSVRKLPECISCVVKRQYWIDGQSFGSVEDAVLYLIETPEPAGADNTWN